MSSAQMYGILDNDGTFSRIQLWPLLYTTIYSIYMERIIKFVTSLYISWNYCSKKLNKSNAWYYFYFFYITTQVHFLKSSAGYWIPLVAHWTIVMSVTHLLTEHLPFFSLCKLTNFLFDTYKVDASLFNTGSFNFTILHWVWTFIPYLALPSIIAHEQ